MKGYNSGPEIKEYSQIKWKAVKKYDMTDLIFEQKNLQNN